MGYLNGASKTLKSPKYLSLLLKGLLGWHHFGWSHTFCSRSLQNSRDSSVDLSQYPPERIRNFSIIAHVDHGKSTLADRLLELTGTIKRGHGQPQYLDKLQVERERGITVKAQTATIFLLNLIDTPGHVDFSYEVSRSLAACQGVLLVVDAAQGQGLEQVLPAVIERIPPPPGKMGYVVSGMRSTKEARVGDTLHHNKSIVEPLPGFKPAKHMVFSGLYPADGSDFEALNHAIERLTCNDASVSVTKESSTALGLGFRCGFLGLLHMDVFHQRLEQEYGAHIISTVPTVPYIFEYSDGSKIQVQNPAALASNPGKRVTACWEPTVIATIIIPSEYVGPVITLCSERRGEQLEYSFIDSQRAFMKYRLPLREIVVDFYNELKSITSGYASFDYEDAEYQASDLVKLDILLNGQPVDAMATIVHNLKAQRVGRELVEKLKKFIDRQMFEIVIQAAIGSKIIARETISAMRKNVLAKCYGGDVTRKRKLLEKQKEGKKRMKRVGSVDIPQEAFHELLKVS
ncbi:unnamed protein product, partial [Vitis vinifera]